METNNRKQQIDAFFNHYRDVFNHAISVDFPEVEQSAGLYSESFIGANPLGVQCGKNDQELRDVLLKGYKFYRDIGLTSMDIYFQRNHYPG